MSETVSCHRLLARQLRKAAFTNTSDPSVKRLLSLVSDAYREFEHDRELLERAMAVSSDEMKQKNKELKRHVEIARGASEAKGAFLANMSHEIRTPLGGIIGLSEMLSQQQLTTDARHLCELIQRSAAGLLGVINDILDVSKIEAGKLTIDKHPTPIRNIIADLLEVFAASFSERSHEFVFHCEAAVPELLVLDELRVRQIVTNLVGNAIKFTENEGGIVLYLFVEPSDQARLMNLRIAVADTGIGIPEERLAAIFEPFTQADGSTSRSFGGTGLGLTISARLAELMGGRLWVRSRVGVGSIFHLLIPCKVASADDAVPRVPAAMTGSAIELYRGLRVLLAEDNVINQKVACHALGRLGCEVTVVGDGTDAVEAAQGGDFDLILMDCHMPKLSGFDATKEIRAIPGSRSTVPIVAMTALAMEGDRELCLQAGMTDYLSKPFNQGELLEVLARTLHKTSS